MNDIGRTKRRALVTGGTGFVGGSLCNALIKKNYQVTALVRKNSNTTFLKKIGVKLAVGDLRDPASLNPSFSNIDVVYHIAAAFRETKLSDKDYYDVNVVGVRNIIEGTAKSGIKRFVHCSTIGVHGDTGRSPATEETKFSPPDYYCKTKLEGELLARELFKKLNLKGTVFRPLGIYGPGDTRFLKLCRSVSKNRFFMIGSGEIFYHLTYIDDLCEGILLCGEKQEAIGEVFILGGEEFVTLNQFVQIIADTAGKSAPKIKIPFIPVMIAAKLCESICRPMGIAPPLYPRRVEFFSKNRAADISKAKEILGFQPKTDLKTGIARTFSWYRDEGWI